MKKTDSLVEKVQGMKRTRLNGLLTKPTYERAIHWVAWNDEPSIMDWEDIRDFISVLIVADLFGKTAETVARDITELRRAESEKE